MGYDIPIENFDMFLESQDLIDFAIEFNEFDMAYMEQQKRWQKEYNKEYSKANREHINQMSRERYANNKDMYIEYAKNYRKNNPDKVHEWSKKSYYKYKDEISKRRKITRDANKDNRNDHYRKQYSENVERCSKCIYCEIKDVKNDGTEIKHCDKTNRNGSKMGKLRNCEYFTMKEV